MRHNFATLAQRMQRFNMRQDAAEQTIIAAGVVVTDDAVADHGADEAFRLAESQIVAAFTERLDDVRDAARLTMKSHAIAPAPLSNLVVQYKYDADILATRLVAHMRVGWVARD